VLFRSSAFVASAAGSDALRSSIAGPASAAEALGRTLADQLLDRGARALLAASGDRV